MTELTAGLGRSARAAHPGMLAGLGAGALLAIALFFWLGFARDLIWLVESIGRTGVVLLVANAVLVLVVTVPRWLRHRDLLEPLYFLAFLFVLIFIFRPIQALHRPDFTARLIPSDASLIQLALLYGGLSFAALWLGYRSGFGERWARGLPRFTPTWSQSWILAVGVIYVAIGVAGFAFAVSRSGGFALFWATLSGRALLAETGSMVFASTLYLVSAAAVVLGTNWIFFRRGMWLFGAVLALSVVLNTSLGGRSGVLIQLLGLVVIFYYSRLHRHQAATTRMAAVLGFGLLAIVFVVGLGILRSPLTTVAGRGDLKALSAAEVGERFVSEFNQFDWFVIILDLTPQTVPYQHGATFAQLLGQFIPRMIWPDKPPPFEYTLTRMVTGTESGSPFTIAGEFYLNFGPVGMLLGMVFFGVLCRTAYAYLRAYPDNAAVVLLYGVFFANLPHFYTRNFAPMMFAFLLFILPIGVALRLIAPARAGEGGPTSGAAVRLG